MPAAAKTLQDSKRASRKVRDSGHTPVPQHIRRRQSEEAVLASAERLFVERGYHRTAIDDIAGSAGLTKGAVYFHFRDKTDVLVALLRRAEDRVFFPIFSRVEGDALNPVQQLVEYVHGWGRAAIRQRHSLFLPILMSFEFLGTGGDIEKRIDGMYARSYEVVTRIIMAGRNEGLMREDGSTREQAAVVVALMDGMLLEWLRRGNTLEGREVVRSTRTTVLSGLLTPNGLRLAQRKSGT